MCRNASCSIYREILAISSSFLSASEKSMGSGLLGKSTSLWKIQAVIGDILTAVSDPSFQ